MNDMEMVGMDGVASMHTKADKELDGETRTKHSVAE